MFSFRVVDVILLYSAFPLLHSFLLSLPPLLPSCSFISLPAAPNNIKYEAVKEDLGKIAGVKQAHSLHIWSLTLDKVALSAHLVLGERKLIIFLAQTTLSLPPIPLCVIHVQNFSC